MANKRHLALLKRSVKKWNEWREENFHIEPDLVRAYLLGWSLPGANLIQADLSGANLSGANLSGANLCRAYLWGTDLASASLNQADLSTADLSGAVLTGAQLIEANLSGALLFGAKLNRADLSRADLGAADLGRTDLSEANLSGADLRNADLSEANLSQATLSREQLSGADFKNSTMGYTVVADIDLSTVRELEHVQHLWPSTIGIDTIYRSKGKIPEVFLRGAGVPEPFIVQMKALVGAMEPIQFYSCFISYSSKDQEFAERLRTELQSKGVRCWFAPEDMKIGDGDFREWKDHDKYMKAFERLMRDLKAGDEAAASAEE
jgi:hypothetical protein